MDLDFEATRQRINERLNQELTRIRNLPKKSKIKICNKHGLKHAHHMNTGLLKNLEVNLAGIKREQRRVVNELNKKRNAFTDNTQRSFPRLLPIPEKDGDVDKKKGFQNRHSPHRFHASWSQPELPNYHSRIQRLENQHRKDLLMAITEHSKRTTKQIIEKNIKKMERSSSPNSETENGSLVNRLNRRYDLRKSCFPLLLGRGNTRPSLIGTIPEKKREHSKADAYYKGTTFFMPETGLHSKVEKPQQKIRKIIEGKVDSHHGKDVHAVSQRLRKNKLKPNFLPETEASKSEIQQERLKQTTIEGKVVRQSGKSVSQHISQDELKLNQTTGIKNSIQK